MALFCPDAGDINICPQADQGNAFCGKLAWHEAKAPPQGARRMGGWRMFQPIANGIAVAL